MLGTGPHHQRHSELYHQHELRRDGRIMCNISMVHVVYRRLQKKAHGFVFMDIDRVTYRGAGTIELIVHEIRGIHGAGFHNHSQCTV